MSSELIAGLETLSEGVAGTPRTLVILLHGYSMTASDLAPFGRSLGVPARFLFPQAPLAAVPRGRAWWEADLAARAARRTHGPGDLAWRIPADLAVARRQLAEYVSGCAARFRPERLWVGGFCQGGMLACDWLLHDAPAVDGLLLLSASRLNFDAWQQRRGPLRGLAVFISHGRSDPEVSFAAGEALRDFALESGARVTWEAFAGGHETPLPVWRSLRRFLNSPSAGNPTEQSTANAGCADEP